MSAPLELARLAVLSRYGVAVEGLRWVALGSGGGFSGASVWRGDDASGRPVLALKAWPADATPDRLASIHALLRRAAHMPFIPTVLPTRDRATVTVEAGRVWDIARWMPGTADFRAHPTATRLTNTATALARLHRAWEPATPTTAPCPAVRRRLRVLADFDAARPALVRPPSFGHAGLDAAVRRATGAVAARHEAARQSLLPWANRPVAIRPCACDLWHDHVLFSGDAVTGLIDFGAAKPDHVAVDLARTFGDLVGGDDARFAAALDAYRAAGGPLDLPPDFVRLLDRTGVVGAAAGWLVQLTATARHYADPGAVAARLNHLLDRLEAY